MQRFLSDADKKRTVAGEMLARQMISKHLNLPEEDILFAQTKGGKPYAQGLPVCFSISHSSDKVVCAVSDKSIGVDIEKLRPLKPGMVSRVCSEKEREYVLCITEEEERAIRFLKLWTLKEAYFKCFGGERNFKEIDALAHIDCAKLTDDGYILSVIEEESK